MPTRQDLQVFAGPNENAIVLERYEAFNWDARPTWPVPPVYRNTPTAEARGPVVDAGAGAASDYERLAAQRIEVMDCVVLVRSGAAPATLAREAEARGARAARACAAQARRCDVARRRVGLGPAARGWQVPLWLQAARGADPRGRGRRDRRVRSEDGATVTVQVGPGPVEVRIALEVPAHETEQLVHIARSPGANLAEQVAVYAPLATLGTDGLAAAETVTALLIAREPARPRNLAVILGFRPSGLVFKGEASVLQPLTDSIDAPPARGRELGALLAYSTDLAGTAADGFVLVDRFLDPDQASMRSVARAVASADFAAALRDLPWVPKPVTPQSDSTPRVGSPR